ncbi:MAG: hypothetical protein J1F63_01125 [Oscillospiraceae bacterium]|nr:hypothetical protein [Oscillospiraceae bacterium]
MIAVLTLISECLILAFFNTAGVNEVSDSFATVLIIVFSVAYLFELGKNERLKNISVPLFLGYLFRLFLLFFDLYGQNIYHLPNSGADSSMFYRTASELATIGKTNRNEEFTIFMSMVFKFIGTSRLFSQFLLMLCSVVAMHMAGMILDELIEDDIAKNKSMYILCLLPNFAILSSIFLRESIVTMFVSISLYCFVRWFTQKNEMFFAAAFIFVFLGAWFHSGVVGLAVGYIAVRLLYDSREEKLKISVKSILLAVVFLFVFIFLFNNYSDTLFGKMQGVESLGDVANTNDEGDSSYAAYVGNSNNPLNMVIFTIPRIVYFLFSPFPWQWRGLSDIIAFCFSSMFYLLAITSAIQYLKSGETTNKRITVVLLILAMCTVFVFAWGTSNTGTATRHRDKMVVLYLILYSVTQKGMRTSECAGFI